MTTRERFHKVMEGDASVDRGPVIEWAMWWDQTIRSWEEEGMPKGMKDEEVFAYYGLDCNTEFWFPHITKDCPKPASNRVVPGYIKNEED